MRLLAGLVSPSPHYFGTERALAHTVVRQAMQVVGGHTRELAAQALKALTVMEGLTFCGPADAAERAPLVAFNVRA